MFISRSSTGLIKINYLYVPSLLQCCLLALLLNQGKFSIKLALFSFINSVWYIKALVLFEGLLGGSCYVNAYRLINKQINEKDREFSMAVTTASDSLGITVAALTSVSIQDALCSWQISHGNFLCKL